MVFNVSSVGENYAAIADALSKFPQVSLVGVAKGQPREQVEAAIAAGLSIVANNYVQEGAKLMEDMSSASVSWHFIGHIQSRKAKNLASYHCIQSLDRASIAQALEERLKATSRKMQALIQINIGEEPQKSGILPSDLDHFLEEIPFLSHLEIKGLMALPPLTAAPEQRRPYFQRMRRLFDAYRTAQRWTTLSMGMSDDYLIAAEEGSTMVRVGTLLFGSRA